MEFCATAGALAALRGLQSKPESGTALAVPGAMIESALLFSGAHGELPQGVQVLERVVYEPEAGAVARALLGHWMLRRLPARLAGDVSVADGAGEVCADSVWCGGEIVETEAYLVGDPACHAYVRETARNRSMWGREGHAYVFNIYGSYKCFNAVCGPPGVAEAVLIRALRPRFGIEQMNQLRLCARERDLLSGPSKLCQALGIERDLDGADLCDALGPVILARNLERESFVRQHGPTVVCTRIGLTRGAEAPLRFYLQQDPNVSRKATQAQISGIEHLSSI